MKARKVGLGSGQLSSPGLYRRHDAFLRHHIQEPVCLFGYSLGGMVALMVAAQYPEGVRAVSVGDAPLSRGTFQEHIRQSRGRIAAWRDLCGRQKSMVQVVEALKNAPMEVPGNLEPVPMREVYGEDSTILAWLAANLYQTDPDMLTALLERFDVTTTGYGCRLSCRPSGARSCCSRLTRLRAAS